MKFKPAKLELKNGETIYIAAVTDPLGQVDVKVVTEDGEEVACGILAVITPKGLWRVGGIDEDINLPLGKDGRLKLDK